MPSPDLEGYKNAQARLRAQFGQDVPFFTPTPTTWPGGIPTDEAGVPLDPEVQPLASGFASGVLRCNVVSKPILRTLEVPATDAPMGLKDRSKLVLLAGYDEFVAAGVSGATFVEVYGAKYKIEAMLNDQVGNGPTQRKLIFLEKM
jgi:hypothetical protein